MLKRISTWSLILSCCALTSCSTISGLTANWESESEKGTQAFRDRRYQDAIRHYKTALKTIPPTAAPTEYDIYVHMGRAQIEVGDLDGAEKNLKNAIEIDDGAASKSEIFQRLALVRLQQGRKEDAEKFYASALAAAQEAGRKRKTDEIAYEYKSLLTSMGRNQEAEAVVEGISADEPDLRNPREIRIGYRKQADDAFAAKNLADAQKLYQLALKESRALNDAALIAKDTEALGMVFLMKENYGGAEMCLEDAKVYYNHGPKGFDRRAVPCLNGLAVVYTHGGRHAEAQGVLKEILRLTETNDDPNPLVLANVLSNLGVTYERTGDHAREIPLLERARAMHRQAKNWDLYVTDTLRLIVAYREQKQPAKAAKLQKELNRAPIKQDKLMKLIAHLSNAADKAGQKELAGAYMSADKKL